MRGYVPGRDTFETVDDVPRGRPVHLPAEEWHRRSRRLQDGVFWFKHFLIIAIIAVVIWVGLDALLGTVDTFSWVDAAVYTVVFFTMTYAAETYHSNREVERGTYSGLFEYGLQWRMFESSYYFFLPYCQIEDVKVRHRVNDTVMEVYLQGFKRPLGFTELFEVLGPDGYVELKRRVGRVTPVPEVPKVHIYGDRLPATTPSPLFSEVRPRPYDYSAPLRF